MFQTDNTEISSYDLCEKFAPLPVPLQVFLTVMDSKI